MDTSPDGLIERITRHVVKWQVVPPAIAFLHMNMPLSFVGSQALLILQPVLDVVLPHQMTAEWAALFADRKQVEQLIARLEAAQAGRQMP